ncbi:MAG: hypothetical protein KTM48_02360, partial [Wolbachia endosymbiont of Pissodes strobi]|nr:hypothetical protein [Wolbachia endosymbiont of Pissodes strobi]
QIVEKIDFKKGRQYKNKFLTSILDWQIEWHGVWYKNCPVGRNELSMFLQFQHRPQVALSPVKVHRVL